VGDRLRDVLPAGGFGGRGLLVERADAAEAAGASAAGFPVVRDLSAAVDVILG
jgi:hypothetical protein